MLRHSVATVLHVWTYTGQKSQASVRVTQILRLLYFNRIVGAVSFQAVTASRNLQVWASLNVNFSWAELLIHSANPVTFWLRLSVFKFWMISDSIRSCLGLSKTYNRRLRNCWLCNAGFNCKFTEHIASSFSEETRMVCKCDILSPGKCFQMCLGPVSCFCLGPCLSQQNSLTFFSRAIWDTQDKKLPWNRKLYSFPSVKCGNVRAVG